MIYKIMPYKIGVSYTDEIMNKKGSRKYINIRIIDMDGDVYQIPINECDKQLVDYIAASLLDFNRWMKSNIKPEKNPLIINPTVIDTEELDCPDKNDVAYQ